MPDASTHPELQLSAIAIVTALAAEYWPSNASASIYPPDLASFHRILDAMRHHLETQKAEDSQIGAAFLERCGSSDNEDPEFVGRSIRYALTALGAEITWTT